MTIVLFSGLALAAFQFSKRLPADYERIALAAARTAIVLVNFGFWIGSLWGDPLFLLSRMAGKARAAPRLEDVVIPANVFSIAWAVVLIGAALWAMRANRRWLVNIVAAVRGHSLLYAVVRAPRRHAALGLARRSADAGDRAGAVGFQSPRGGGLTPASRPMRPRWVKPKPAAYFRP